MSGATNRKVSVALVGAGNMAREHARAFAREPDARLSGICSRSPERARALAAEFGIERVYGSIEEMYNATRAQLVVVCVPELQMNAVSTSCFAYPWTILLEKPAGYDFADAQSIANRAIGEGADARTFVALNRRAYHATREALGLVDAAAEGARLIVVQDQQDMNAARAAGQPEPVVRNWMFANSVHTIDYLNVFGRGEIARVSTVVPWDAQRPGFVVAKVEFSSGDIGLYQGIWNGPGPWAVTVTTPSVRVEMRPLERAFVQRRGERTVHELPAAAEDVELKAGLAYQARQSLRAARGEPHALASLAAALASARLCARIFGLA